MTDRTPTGRIAVVIVLIILTFLAMHALFAQPLACGIERWPVKTLTDAAQDSVDLGSIPTTVDSLRRLPAPDVRHARDRAANAEYHVFMLRAVGIGFKLEGDRDIHLVIAAPADTAKTMIVEFPDSTCGRTHIERVRLGERSARRMLVQVLGQPTARFRRFRRPVPMILTGVGFFDYLHGQIGAAPNGIELHPAVAIAFEARP